MEGKLRPIQYAKSAVLLTRTIHACFTAGAVNEDTHTPVHNLPS